MFSVNPQDNSISLSRGDTGSVSFQASGYTFGENDRALFTVKAATGEQLFQKAYALNGTVNGLFVVEFKNAMTDTWAAGQYSYDVRYIINPYYDENGMIIDGDQVITPKMASSINIISVVGEV